MKISFALFVIFCFLCLPSLAKKSSRKKPACGGFFKESSGVLTSPSYPNDYPSNSRCTWDFKVKPGQKILFTFEEFGIEEDAKCDYDALYIQEKRGKKYKNQLKVCGKKVPKPFKTSSNTARIIFSSDESGEESGFKIKWTAVSDKQECGGFFNSSSGSIASPNFPGSYPNNAECEYTISVPFGHVLALKIEQLDIELDSNCEFDKLQIFDGSSEKAHSLGKFCGSKISKPTLRPSGNKVFVTFASDDSNGGRGFNISWSSKKISTEKAGPRKCGTSKYSTRIVGGIFAKKGAFPWQAAIIWRVGFSKEKQFCGGSLIDREWILTAAHCFVNGRDPSYYKIRLGDHNLKSNDHTEQEFNVTALLVHIGYNSITNDNDIALLRLSRKATINDHVNTICLPEPADQVPAGTRCKITGWGATNEHGSTSSVLMEAEVPIVNRSVCAHDMIYGKKITKNMMCGGFARGGIDTCQGDSGGPMQCRNSTDRSQWVLQGVTSWGRGCGRKLKYGVYAIVKNYLMWINIMKNASKQKPTHKPSPKPPVPVTDGPKNGSENTGHVIPKPPIPGSNGNNIPKPPVPGSNGNNIPKPPVPGSNGNNIPKPPVPGSNGNNIPKPPVPGSNGNNIPKPPIPGASGNNIPKPPIPGANGNNIPMPPIPGANGNNIIMPPIPRNAA